MGANSRYVKNLLVLCLAILGAVSASSCAESTAPLTGGLDVSVETISAPADVDPDGYSIVVDPGHYAVAAGTTSGAHVDLPVGRHVVRLEGLATNCSLTGATEHSVDIIAGQSISASFTVKCVARQIINPTEGVQPIAYVVLALTGEEIHVVNSDGTGERNLSRGGIRDTDPAWSPDGKRIAFASKRSGYWEIYIMDADGTNQIHVTASSPPEYIAEDHAPTWSPDGKRIAFSGNGTNGYTQIHIIGVDGSNHVRLTTTTGYSTHPDWSPDGSQIVFAHDAIEMPGLVVMSSDGSNQNQITFNYRGDYSPVWSPDGKRIAFSGTLYYTNDIFVVNANGSARTQVSRGLPYVDNPTWSPDGSKIAFGSVSGGCGPVFDGYWRCDSYVQVMSLDGARERVFAPASSPAWRPRVESSGPGAWDY